MKRMLLEKVFADYGIDEKETDDILERIAEQIGEKLLSGEGVTVGKVGRIFPALKDWSVKDMSEESEAWYIKLALRGEFREKLNEIDRFIEEKFAEIKKPKPECRKLANLDKDRIFEGFALNEETRDELLQMVSTFIDRNLLEEEPVEIEGVGLFEPFTWNSRKKYLHGVKSIKFVPYGSFREKLNICG